MLCDRSVELFSVHLVPTSSKSLYTGRIRLSATASMTRIVFTSYRARRQPASRYGIRLYISLPTPSIPCTGATTGFHRLLTCTHPDISATPHTRFPHLASRFLVLDTRQVQTFGALRP